MWSFRSKACGSAGYDQAQRDLLRATRRLHLLRLSWERRCLPYGHQPTWAVHTSVQPAVHTHSQLSNLDHTITSPCKLNPNTACTLCMAFNLMLHSVLSLTRVAPSPRSSSVLDPGCNISATPNCYDVGPKGPSQGGPSHNASGLCRPVLQAQQNFVIQYPTPTGTGYIWTGTYGPYLFVFFLLQLASHLRRKPLRGDSHFS
jgi:hypothetical protein